jgi:hypothetical protein
MYGLMGAWVVGAAVAVSASGLGQGLLPNQDRIYVSVVDGKDATPPARNVDAFKVWEGGLSRHVASATPATETPCIILIIHGFERDETHDTRKALTAFVDTIRAGSPDAKIAIIGDVQTPKLTNITANAEKLDEAARRFNVSGSNMVYFEAIVDAAKALGKEPSDRRIIVALTKSTKHDADHQTTPQTVAALKKSHAAVWSVDVTPENATRIENLHATLEMDGFVSHASEYSGGGHERIFGTSSLEPTLRQFATLILGQYAVVFEHPSRKGETELRVGVAGVPGEKVIGPGWFVR